MKAFYIGASFALAMTGTSHAETFTNPTLANGLSSVSSTAQSDLQNCLAEKSSSRAVRACTKTLKNVVPDAEIKAQLYTRRALHRLALGHHEAAARDFTQVGDLTGDSSLEALGHGFVAMLDQDLGTARRKFEDCNNRGSVAPLAEYGLGLTFQMAGESEEARAAYTRALDLRPGWTAVVEQIATLD